MFNWGMIFRLLNFLPIMQVVQSFVAVKGQKPTENSEADEALLVLIRHADERINAVEFENESLRNRVKNMESTLTSLQVYLFVAIVVAVIGLLLAILVVSNQITPGHR